MGLILFAFVLSVVAFIDGLIHFNIVNIVVGGLISYVIIRLFYDNI